MKRVSLLYHDVVAPGRFGESGFRGDLANSYKLEDARFREHLAALSRAAGGRIARLGDPEPPDGPPGPAVYLTFDDGGVSAATRVADLLEEAGWRGHLFVTTGRIGTRGFLGAGQIRALAGRGHVVGTHSHSHPPRMAELPLHRLVAEWQDSAAALADVLGTPVTSGSIPAGGYAPRIARAAEEAGLTVLFTSEPRVRSWTVGRDSGVRILGRFCLRRWSSAEEAARLVAPRSAARARQAATWQAKKAAKKIARRPYAALQRRLVR